MFFLFVLVDLEVTTCNTQYLKNIFKTHVFGLFPLGLGFNPFFSVWFSLLSNVQTRLPATAQRHGLRPRSLSAELRLDVCDGLGAPVDGGKGMDKGRWKDVVWFGRFGLVCFLFFFRLVWFGLVSFLCFFVNLKYL